MTQFLYFLSKNSDKVLYSVFTLLKIALMHAFILLSYLVCTHLASVFHAFILLSYLVHTFIQSLHLIQASVCFYISSSYFHFVFISSTFFHSASYLDCAFYLFYIFIQSLISFCFENLSLSLSLNLK